MLRLTSKWEFNLYQRIIHFMHTLFWHPIADQFPCWGVVKHSFIHLFIYQRMFTIIVLLVFCCCCVLGFFVFFNLVFFNVILVLIEKWMYDGNFNTCNEDYEYLCWMLTFCLSEFHTASLLTNPRLLLCSESSLLCSLLVYPSAGAW